MGKLWRTGILAGLLCLALFALVAPLQADTVVYAGDWVTLIGLAGSQQVRATVSYLTATQLYKYEYEVKYTSATNFYRFSVANPHLLAYSASSNDLPLKFANPSYTGTNSINWGRVPGSGTLSGSVQTPLLVKFWYSSVYSYRTNVNTSVFAGGATTSSSGMTVGMNTPEPASVMALGAGLCGAGGAFVRKLRRRK